MTYCDVCQGNKYVRLPHYPELNVLDQLYDDVSVPSAPQCAFKEFACPQCVPMVPYRRVRAMKVTTAYPAAAFGKYQMPIERSLAARFGEYLYREGLIRFTTSGSQDLGKVAEKITVTAHLGVVRREDVVKTGAVEEVATTSAPPLPRRIRDRLKLSPKARLWDPPVEVSWPEPDEPVTDEFEEPKSALGARFSGLEIE